MSSTYRNRFSSFAGTSAENQTSYDRYLQKKQSAINSNKTSIASAKELATQHLTGEFIKGASVEGAVRLLKPTVKAGLDYLDRGGVKGGARLSNWVDRKMGVSKFQPREGAGIDNKPNTGVEGLEDADVPTVRTGGDYSVIDNYEAPESNGLVDSANSVPTRDVVRPQARMGETKEDTGDMGVEMGDNPSASSAARSVRDARPELDGLGDEVATESADAGASTAIDEGATVGLETAGAALDATGVGAVIGVPLQIAGAVLEGGAIYEAGKSIVDWFKQDAVGKMASIPKSFSTLTSSGLGATPTMDTTMDAPSGGGSW